MKQCFKEYDKDNSGCIEREEMQQVLNGLNVRYTEVTCSLFTHYFCLLIIFNRMI